MSDKDIRTWHYGLVARWWSEFDEGGVDVEFFRSEEHTSELQSRTNLVCRLLLEKKKKQKIQQNTTNTTE